MKCVCGYEYEQTWEADGKEIIVGDEDFIQLDCHVTSRKDWEDKKVYLFACPKCSTVKVEFPYFW